MADLVIQPVWQVLDGNGDAIAGAQATFFDSGTVTPQIVYSDSGLTVPHPSPLLANGNGVFPPVFVGPNPLKTVIKDATGAAVDTIDPTPKAPSGATGAASITFSPIPAIPVSNVQGAIERVQTNTEQVQTNLTAAVQSLTKWQTPQAATSGTAFDFTGIPAWATEIIIVFQGISLSGTDHILVQAGTSAGIYSAAYSVSGSIDGATAASALSNSGFVIYHGTAADGLVGEMRLVKSDPSGNTWLSKHNCARGPAKISTGAGTVGLPGALDRVRITRTGTNTFDGASSSVNVGWR